MKKTFITLLLLYTVNQYVDAIYLAEGGSRAQYPYGIRSVKCDTKEGCRKVCENTVRNNIKRWKIAGQKGQFLDFLASRYAPIGVENDPHQLNRNWKKNVEYYLKKGA